MAVTAPSMLCVEIIDAEHDDQDARVHAVRVLCEEMGYDPRDAITYVGQHPSEVPCRQSLEKQSTLVNFDEDVHDELALRLLRRARECEQDDARWARNAARVKGASRVGMAQEGALYTLADGDTTAVRAGRG